MPLYIFGCGYSFTFWISMFVLLSVTFVLTQFLCVIALLFWCNCIFCVQMNFDANGKNDRYFPKLHSLVP
jgi:hypothetical protein